MILRFAIIERLDLKDLFINYKNEFKRKFGVDTVLKVLCNTNGHKPSKLKQKTKGVYIFMINDKICFKVGKAGLESIARWSSQHYNPNSCSSNLAKSLLQNKDILRSYLPNDMIPEVNLLNKDNIGSWIKCNLIRIEFIIENDKEDFSLNLLEAFLQFKLKPIYEGNKA